MAEHVKLHWVNGDANLSDALGKEGAETVFHDFSGTATGVAAASINALSVAGARVHQVGARANKTALPGPVPAKLGVDTIAASFSTQRFSRTDLLDNGRQRQRHENEEHPSVGPPSRRLICGCTLRETGRGHGRCA